MFKNIFSNTLDLQISAWFLSHRSEWGIGLFKVVTFFASWEFIVIASILVITVFYLNNESFLIVPYIFVIAGTEVSIFILKNYFNRPRFVSSAIVTTSASFPSAHAAIALAFYGYIAYVMIRHHEVKMGWLIIAISCLIILLIGLSRVYLGAHYFSDIVVAYIVASIFLFSGMYISNKRSKNNAESLNYR